MPVRLRPLALPGVLFLVALAARLATALHAPDPAYADSAYYVDAARALAAGHGFSIDAVWAFVDLGGRLPAQGVLPVPSFGHWAPLASIVQLPFIWLLGPTAIASDLPFVLAGAAMAPLAWAIAREAEAGPVIATGTALLVALPGAMLPFLGQADNFALYGLLAGLALLLTTRALRAGGDPVRLALAGLLGGLATLARTDGVLLLAALALAWLLANRRARLPRRGLVLAGLAAAAVIAPWELRQLATWGVLSPSTASGRVFLLRDISEWDSLTIPATLDHLLSWGVGPLLGSRVEALSWLLGDVAVLLCGLVLAPFLLVGAALRLRRGRIWGPAAIYAAILVPFSVILAAAHVAGGTFLHSATALLPWIALLEVEGVAAATGAVAARRRSWDRDHATRFFVSVAVLAMAGLAAFTTLTSHANWRNDAAVERSLAAELAVVADPTDRIMATDAASTLYWTGHPAVVLVRDDPATVREVAARYDVRWLAVRRSDRAEMSADLLAGGSRPAWLGPPSDVWSADGEAIEGLGPAADTALFPICLAPDDHRCRP